MAELKAEETALVEAATRGDQEAFRQLVEPISRELHLFSYRILGSFHDAEDILQDAQLKAWRRLDSYDRRASFRAWMYKIVTNTSLDALRTRRRRVLPQDASVVVAALGITYIIFPYGNASRCLSKLLAQASRMVKLDVLFRVDSLSLIAKDDAT